MAAWLIAHSQLLYTAAVVGGFAAVAVWETVAPLRQPQAALGPRWGTNIALLAINSVVVHAVLPLTAVAAAAWAQDRGWGLLNGLAWPSPMAGLLAGLMGLLGLLGLDLARWLLHHAMHRVGWLWRLHRVHHSDTDYDCTIGLRFHPLEAVIGAAAMVGVVLLLGVPPAVVVLSDVLTIALGYVAHGNVSLPPRWDRGLRRVFVTPDMHRVHHSCVRRESMSNFGAVFSFWDRGFGSYLAAPSAGHRGMTIGLEDLREPGQLTLLQLLKLPLRVRLRA